MSGKHSPPLRRHRLTNITMARCEINTLQVPFGKQIFKQLFYLICYYQFLEDWECIERSEQLLLRGVSTGFWFSRFQFLHGSAGPCSQQARTIRRPFPNVNKNSTGNSYKVRKIIASISRSSCIIKNNDEQFSSASEFTALFTCVSQLFVKVGYVFLEIPDNLKM